MWELSKAQKSALELNEELSFHVISTPEIKDRFCKLIEENIINKTGTDISSYHDVLKNTLPNNETLDRLSKETIRNITQNILNTLTNTGEISPEKRKLITKKVTQWGGSRGVLRSQKIQNMNPLNDEEKQVLEQIRVSNNPKYKRWTARNIKVIQEEFIAATGNKQHSYFKIKHYFHQFNTNKKITTPRNDPDEINTLKELFKQYFNPPKKLPTKEIMEILNAKHGHNRTENSIEAYIRNHIKTADQKMKNEDPRSKEEKEALEFFKDKKIDFRHKTGKSAWKINWELVFETYQSLYPETQRSTRAVEHKIKELRK